MNKVSKPSVRGFDAADYLHDEDDIAEYLRIVVADGDPALIAAALGDIAKARNISQLSRDTGISREGLYKALSDQGNPTLETVMKVVKALGLQLTIEPAKAREAA